MSKYIKAFITFIFPIIFLIFGLIYNNNYIELWLTLAIFTFVIVTAVLEAIFNAKMPKVINKLIVTIDYLLAFAYFGYNFLAFYDLLKYLTSITATKELILASGSKGYLVFILIQIAQVVFLPIPAVALMVVGLVIYGPLKTIIFCSIGVCVGSYISFLFGKTFGYKFVSWLIGEDRVNKYSAILKNNGKFILSVVFIFPFFPDDLFCMIAGISSMTFKEFFVLASLLRPITIIIVCLFGGGAILKLGRVGGIFIVIAAIAIIFTMALFFAKNKKMRSIMTLMKQK